MRIWMISALLVCLGISFAALPEPALGVDLSYKGCVLNRTNRRIKGKIYQTDGGLTPYRTSYTAWPHRLWCRILPEGDYVITRQWEKTESEQTFSVDGDNPMTYKRRKVYWFIEYK